MKKIYNTPKTTFVILQTDSMIAESLPVYQSEKSFSSSLSREDRGSSWEDDEE